MSEWAFRSKIFAKKSKILFLVCFLYDFKFFYRKMSELLIFAHFLFFGEWCEQFAHDRSFLLSDVSESLRLLTKNERSWENRSGRSPKMSEWVNCSFFGANRSFAQFGQKTRYSLGKPMSEFPALQKCQWVASVPDTTLQMEIQYTLK